MVDNDNTKLAAVSLIQSGMATIAEVAWLAGRSREIVRYWAGAPEHVAGIMPAARAKRLRAQWNKALKISKSSS